MVPKRKKCSFSGAFKLLVIKRMERGESGAALARELTIKREVLYRWRDAVRAGGDRSRWCGRLILPRSSTRPA